MDPVVIIGAGMAAYGVARELRKLDRITPLILVSADAANAYAKPMLSNAFALGKAAAQLISQSAPEMAAQLDAQVLTHTEVTAIDSAAKIIHTSEGDIAYGKLVLALGAQPIRLPIAGDAADQVLSVNHIDDYARLRTRLAAIGRASARVTILGAGLIGCEFAEDLVAGGLEVTLVDPNPLPLAALAAPSLSHGLAKAWTAHPIALKLGTTAASVAHGDGALLVTLANGEQVTADIVLSAVGLRPSIALARSAGLETDRGIVIDQFGRTSAEDIYALGDCAQYCTAEGSAVMPYVAPMLTAARAIASTLAGTPKAIELKADAVIVKTPSYKLALLPPPPGAVGQWVSSDDGERTTARFIDGQGALRGFGVSMHTPAVRNALLGELHKT